MKIDWFGWDGRKGMSKRGPHWFVSRGANFFYACLGGVCSVTVPWFWSHAAIRQMGYDEGWNAGYQSGSVRGDGGPTR